MNMEKNEHKNIYINGVICSGPSLLNETREFVLLVESVADRCIVL